MMLKLIKEADKLIGKRWLWHRLKPERSSAYYLTPHEEKLEYDSS